MRSKPPSEWSRGLEQQTVTVGFFQRVCTPTQGSTGSRPGGMAVWTFRPLV
jgi:hypothetical protein